MFGLAYHKNYNKYDLGLDHPLVGDKPKRTLDFFKEQKILGEVTVFQPQRATETDLLRVHNPRYIERIKSLSKTGGMLALDTPAPKGIYEIARLATGGTLLCGKKLLEGYTCMMNPLAGFHHASASFSSGFCFFNDIAITIEYLREKHHLKRFLIIDLDVHHANGTQEIYYNDPSVLLISFHQDGRTLYPGTGAIEKIGRDSGEGYTVNLPLPPGTGNKSYYSAFERIVPPVTLQFNPDIIIYQSGVDTHHSDPLANLRLTLPIYYQLGQRIAKLSAQTCHRLLVCFGGGYNSQSSVQAYFNLVNGLMGRTDIISENTFSDPPSSNISSSVDDLIAELSNIWNFSSRFSNQ